MPFKLFSPSKEAVDIGDVFGNLQLSGRSAAAREVPDVREGVLSCCLPERSGGARLTGEVLGRHFFR